MDAIGSKPIISFPAAPVQQAAPAALPLPKPVADTPAPAEVQVATADQRRYEAVRQAAQSAPFVYPLGDRTFTIFKDSSGQFVTRYYSQRTGQISYVPEPEVLKQSSTYSAPVVNIKA